MTPLRPHPTARCTPRLTNACLLLLAFGLQTSWLAAQQPGAQLPGAQPPPAQQPEQKLPKLSEMELPTARELLTRKPLDWIVLNRDDEVIVCESVSPRPDTLAKMDDAIQRKRRSTPSRSEQFQRELEDLHYVSVILPNVQGAPEYRLHRNHIKEIIHHEDLMLRRANQLMDDGDLAGAFELLFALDRSRSNWPGFEDARRRHLFLEADATWRQGAPEAAIALLEELHTRQNDYPGLKKKLGDIIDELVSAAMAQHDFRRARFFLRRLETIDKPSAVAARWRSDLLERTQQLVDQARAAEQARDYSDAVALVESAARILPRAPGISELHTRLMRRYPRLTVGVVEPAAEAPLWLPTAADRRRRILTRSYLFQVARVEESPRYTSRFVEEWEPEDLGRKVRIRFRHVRQPWESRPVLTASQFVSLITQRLYPQTPLYDGRLSHAIHTYSVRSPFEAEIQFHRQPLRAQALFAFPLGEETQLDERQSIETSPLLAFGTTPLDGPFLAVEQTPERTALRRTLVEPEASSPFHVAEVVELTYRNHDDAMRAFLRGDVWLLPDVQPRHVAPLRDSKEFILRQYSLPTTHILQFHPQNVWLRDREMRRALSAALDRRKILAEIVLRAEGGPPFEFGRLTTAPFPRQFVTSSNRKISYFAYNQSDRIPQPEQDLTLAISLALAVKKRQQADLPEFRLLVEPDPTLSLVADELITQWKRCGLSVKRVSLTDADREQPHARDSLGWDIVLRSVQMADPVRELWPLLTLDSSARMDGLAILPDWLRQELLALETARDWSTAIDQLKLLHERLASEVQIIPLWEVDRFLLARPQISGIPPAPLNTYDDLETWTLQPWYPTDIP